MNYKSILCDLLERCGYKGIDASMEESIFEYDMVIKYDEDINHLNTILCYNDGMSPMKFDYTDIRKNDILEAIEEQEKAFFEYIGQSKEEYKRDCEESKEYCIFARDIQEYNS